MILIYVLPTIFPVKCVTWSRFSININSKFLTTLFFLTILKPTTFMRTFVTISILFIL